MREALKTIAGFANPAAKQDPGQAAARLARKTLDDIGLFTEANAHVPSIEAPVPADQRRSSQVQVRV
jgi:hypothetical protein